MATYKEVLEFGINQLIANEIEEAKVDGFILFEHFFQMNRMGFLIHGEEIAPSELVEQFRNGIRLRGLHIPVQYITNEQEFYGFSFFVDERVLIPRQDTEILIETIEQKQCLKTSILDVCTGSGCIAVTLDKILNPQSVVAVDISNDALAVAQINKTKNESKVQFIQSDLFENVQGTFDVIVSNPPYIPSKTVLELTKEVKDHEPLLALDGSEDGLFFYKKIVQEAHQYLNKDGYLFFEIGFDQAKDLKNLLESYGFEDIQIKKDLAGLDRVVYGRIK